MLKWLSWMHSQEFVDFIFHSGGSHVALLLLFAILFSETGLLVGFFLPGDSMLLFIGAIVASQKTSTGEPIADIYLVNLVLVAGALIGNQVGYMLGYKTGPAIFARDDSRFFKKKYAVEAHQFYEKHGGRAIIIACFVPVMRTFVPFIAGVAKMPYKLFAFYNVVGGVFWVTSLLWIGFLLGKSPWAKYLHYIILGVIFVSLMPLIWTIVRRLFFSTAPASEGNAQPTPAAKPLNSVD